MRLAASFALVALVSATSASLGLACTPVPSDPATVTAAANAKLPAYKGDLADRFDDGIEPHAVGLALDTYATPKGDPRLRARAEQADVVLRARINTVTGQVESGNHIYQVSFHALERLAGQHPVGDDFTVRIDAASPSLGIVQAMEGQLVGKTLVMFVKNFVRADGDAQLHFHAMPDQPDVIAAVKEAVILDEVK
jgi:hypothetical protein